MNNALLAAAIFVAAIVATIMHNKLDEGPIATLAIQDFFYEQSGLTINIPEESMVEIYDEFVLIKRADGLITMVPNHRIHAVDALVP